MATEAGGESSNHRPYDGDWSRQEAYYDVVGRGCSWISRGKEHYHQIRETMSKIYCCHRGRAYDTHTQTQTHCVTHFSSQSNPIIIVLSLYVCCLPACPPARRRVSLFVTCSDAQRRMRPRKPMGSSLGRDDGG